MKPNLRMVTQTPDERIEALLTELGALMLNRAIPKPRRMELWHAYCEIHACRSPETVKQMEQDMGIGPDAA